MSIGTRKNLIGLLGISILLFGCGSGRLTQLGPPELCDGLKTRRIELNTQRSAAQAAMDHDVELGLHSVPGETFDAVGERDAEAFVQRVRNRWKDEDARFVRALAGIDATLDAQGCRP